MGSQVLYSFLREDGRRTIEIIKILKALNPPENPFVAYILDRQQVEDNREIRRRYAKPYPTLKDAWSDVTDNKELLLIAPEEVLILYKFQIAGDELLRMIGRKPKTSEEPQRRKRERKKINSSYLLP